jgi:hypothetical protein
MNAVQLRDSKDALEVNWLEITIHSQASEVAYRNSFITDLAVDRDNVAELAACCRARWKIDNETFNFLKTDGYNLEHNFGHSKQNLAALLVTLNLLAFALNQVTWAVLQPPRHRNRLPDLPIMGRSASNAGLYQATTAAAALSLLRSLSSGTPKMRRHQPAKAKMRIAGVVTSFLIGATRNCTLIC